MIFVHCTPSSLGIRMSISMTSGLFFLTLRMTSCPLEATSVTIMSGLLLSTICRLWRINS